jgi:hypothetical protein
MAGNPGGCADRIEVMPSALVEVMQPAHERGGYLHGQEYGQPFMKGRATTSVSNGYASWCCPKSREQGGTHNDHEQATILW